MNKYILHIKKKTIENSISAIAEKVDYTGHAKNCETLFRLAYSFKDTAEETFGIKKGEKYSLSIESDNAAGGELFYLEGKGGSDKIEAHEFDVPSFIGFGFSISEILAATFGLSQVA